MQICDCFRAVLPFMSIEGFFSKTSTSRCLDQKRPDLASNIKKAVRGMAVMPATKQQQSKE